MLLGFELCPGHFEHFQVFVKFWRTYILWVWVSAGICRVGQSAAPAAFQGLCFYCQFSFRAVAVLLSAVGSWAVVWPTVQASRPFRVRPPHAQLRGAFWGPRGTVERGIPSPSAPTFPGSLGSPSQAPGQTFRPSRPCPARPYPQPRQCPRPPPVGDREEEGSGDSPLSWGHSPAHRERVLPRGSWHLSGHSCASAR